MNRIILLAVSIFAIFSVAQAQEGKDTHLYSTWDIMEIDTCASAWLIKNFVDKDARFEFYPKGTLIEEGTALNTPDAKFKRTARLSAYETIIQEYQLQDPALLKIGDIIHQIEVNVWYGNLDEDGQALHQKILDIINQAKTSPEALEKSFIVLDEFYNRFKM